MFLDSVLRTNIIESVIVYSTFGWKFLTELTSVESLSQLVVSFFSLLLAYCTVTNKCHAWIRMDKPHYASADLSLLQTAPSIGGASRCYGRWFNVSWSNDRLLNNQRKCCITLQQLVCINFAAAVVVPLMTAKIVCSAENSAPASTKCIKVQCIYINNLKMSLKWRSTLNFFS